MENKYYTPKIEEFHVGFEYYHASFKDQVLSIYTVNNTYDFKNIEDEIKNEIVLIKLLDREDIESLGFKYDSDNFFEGFFNGLIYKILLVDGNVWIYFRQNVGNEKIIDKTSFFGKIKNKSELKKLMVQLGITKN